MAQASITADNEQLRRHDFGTIDHMDKATIDPGTGLDPDRCVADIAGQSRHRAKSDGARKDIAGDAAPDRQHIGANVAMHAAGLANDDVVRLDVTDNPAVKVQLACCCQIAPDDNICGKN